VRSITGESPAVLGESCSNQSALHWDRRRPVRHDSLEVRWATKLTRVDALVAGGTPAVPASAVDLFTRVSLPLGQPENLVVDQSPLHWDRGRPARKASAQHSP
jgi:hypothetical protein